MANLALDLQILRDVLRLSKSRKIQWREDGQPGLGAVFMEHESADHFPVYLRIIGGEMVRNYLKLRCPLVGEYTIWDPQPRSLAPAGRFTRWLGRKWRQARGLKDPTKPKTNGQIFEEQIHLILEEVLNFANQQCARQYDRNDPQKEVRERFWRSFSEKF